MKELRFLLSLDRGRRRWLLAGLALALIAAGASVGLVGTAGWLITASALAGAAGAALEIFAPGALVRAFAVLRTASRYGERLVLHEAIFRVLARLRRRIFAGMAALPWPVLVEQRRSQALTRLLADVERLEQFHAGLLVPTLAATGAGALLALAAWLWLPASLLPLVPAMLVMMLLLCRYAAVAGRRPRLRTALRRDRSRRQLPELLRAHRELFFADPGGRLAEEWLRRDQSLVEAEHRQEDQADRAEAGVQLVTASLLILATAVVSVLLAEQTGEAPWVVLFVLGLLAAAGLWTTLPESWHGTPGILAATRRVQRLALDTPPATTGGGEDPGGGADAWTLEEITLQRGVAEAPLVRSLSLEIAPGSVLCVTGASGSGKSSLLEMLCGLLPPVEGRVRFNGVPVALLNEVQRFRRMAVLPQETTLLSATLRENLCLAAPQTPEADLIAALEATGLDYLVEELDTPVGVNGRALSGGEARRVALIRTLLAPSSSLLLDEPLRGLDEADAGRVLQWLRAMRRHRTLVLFHHSSPPELKPDRVLELG